jgi:hypothetical protein
MSWYALVDFLLDVGQVVAIFLLCVVGPYAIYRLIRTRD